MNSKQPPQDMEASPWVNRDGQPRRLDSRSLFKGQTQVVIAHDGQEYVLRQTRQGKLILTK